MLVSASRNIVFIHIQRTGGDSISRALRDTVPDIAEIGAKHQFARDAAVELGSLWDRSFKFAFVRNPWDRLVSWYSLIRDKGERVPSDRPAANLLWRYVHANSSNFDEFIRNCAGEVETRRGKRYSFAYNQLDYLTDSNGGVIVDFIGRFESFADDWGRIAARVGIPIAPPPHDNGSSHSHYSSYYTPETEAIVRERYRRDIERFGYTFERV